MRIRSNIITVNGACRLVGEVAGLRVLLAAARQEGRLWKTQGTALQDETERHRDEVEILRKQAYAVRDEDSAASDRVDLPGLDGAVGPILAAEVKLYGSCGKLRNSRTGSLFITMAAFRIA